MPCSAWRVTSDAGLSYTFPDKTYVMYGFESYLRCANWVVMRGSLQSLKSDAMFFLQVRNCCQDVVRGILLRHAPLAHANASLFVRHMLLLLLQRCVTSGPMEGGSTGEH